MHTLRSTSLLLLVLAPIWARAQDGGAPGTGSAPATVRSRDGTTIAYERRGQGPALILVSPALSDRAASAGLAALLAPDFTVIAYDRRGRGGSGDTQPFAVRREIEDVEALIDAAGGRAYLFGGSSGAVLALEAADALGPKVAGAVLFEPPFIVDDSRPAIAADLFDRIGALVREGRRGDAVARFLTEGIGVPEEHVDRMREAPMWPDMEGLAHTLPYDGALLEGLQAGRPLPADRWQSISAPTLVIDGERSDPFLRSAVEALVAALPGSGRHTLEGQDHAAMFMAPQTLAPVIRGFLLGSDDADSGAVEGGAGAEPAARER